MAVLPGWEAIWPAWGAVLQGLAPPIAQGPQTAQEFLDGVGAGEDQVKEFKALLE